MDYIDLEGTECTVVKIDEAEARDKAKAKIK